MVQHKKASLVFSRNAGIMTVVSSDIKGTATVSFSSLPDTTVLAKEQMLLEIARLFFIGKGDKIHQKSFNRQIELSDLEAEGFTLAFLKSIVKPDDEYRKIGRNRILMEYFKGTLILTDDLNYYSTSMFVIR